MMTPRKWPALVALLAFFPSSFFLHPSIADLGNPSSLAILKPAAASSATFPSGEYGYLTLNEASGNPRIDTGGGALDMSEVTTAVGSTSGKHGDAANWPPGTGTLESGVGFADFGVPVSAAFWLNVDNLPVATAYVMQGNGGLDTYVYISSGGNIVFGNGTDGDLASTSLGALDSWHLVAFTMDAGANLKTYLDGSLIDTDLAAAGGDGTSIILGAITTLDAAIDEFSIWYRVLSGTEVSDIWNGGTGTFGP